MEQQIVNYQVSSPTPTSLNFSQDCTFDQWQRDLNVARAIGSASQWWIGDALLFGEQKFGENYAQAIDAMDKDRDTLSRYKFVSERIPSSRRREGLNWSMHSEVAGEPESLQETLLSQAKDNNWTVRELRSELKVLKGQAKVKGEEGKLKIILITHGMLEKIREIIQTAVELESEKSIKDYYKENKETLLILDLEK